MIETAQDLPPAPVPPYNDGSEGSVSRRIEEQRPEIVGMMATMSDTDISRETGIPQPTVSRARGRLGIENPVKGGRPIEEVFAIHEPDKLQTLRRRAGKMPDVDLARLLDIGASTVRAYRERHGIDLPVYIEDRFPRLLKLAGTMPDTEVARKLSKPNARVWPASVAAARERHGIPTFRDRPKGRRVEERFPDLIEELRAGEMTHSQLARKYEVRPSTILAAARRNGLATPTVGDGRVRSGRTAVVTGPTSQTPAVNAALLSRFKTRCRKLGERAGDRLGALMAARAATLPTEGPTTRAMLKGSRKRGPKVLTEIRDLFSATCREAGATISAEIEALIAADLG